MTELARRIEMETEREESPWEIANKKAEWDQPWDWAHYDRAFTKTPVNDLFKPEWNW